MNLAIFCVTPMSLESYILYPSCARESIDCMEPLAQRDEAVLEHVPDCYRKTLPVSGALVQTLELTIAVLQLVVSFSLSVIVQINRPPIQTLPL